MAQAGARCEEAALGDIKDMNNEPNKCLNPNCTRDAKIRGICRQCYTAASLLVRRGKVTWEQLEAAGKVTKAKHRGCAGVKVNSWLLDGIK